MAMAMINGLIAKYSKEYHQQASYAVAAVLSWIVAVGAIMLLAMSSLPTH